MYHIQYSPAAKRDLGRLKTYLNSEFGKEVTKRVLTDMTKSIRQLEEQPLKGQPLGNLIDVPTDYRYLVTEKNYVFYRTEAETVKVIRVLNERQDFMRILFGIAEVEEDDLE